MNKFYKRLESLYANMFLFYIPTLLLASKNSNDWGKYLVSCKFGHHIISSEHKNRTQRNVIVDEDYLPY